MASLQADIFFAAGIHASLVAASILALPQLAFGLFFTRRANYAGPALRIAVVEIGALVAGFAVLYFLAGIYPAQTAAIVAGALTKVLSASVITTDALTSPQPIFSLFAVAASVLDVCFSVAFAWCFSTSATEKETVLLAAAMKVCAVVGGVSAWIAARRVPSGAAPWGSRAAA